MKRKTFLSIVSAIAILIGIVALFFPSVLLESKGVFISPPVKVWMSEVGLLLIVIGLITFFIRGEETSIALKGIFFGNILIHLGLFIIEVLAYRNGVIKEISGIIPNGILHLVLFTAFSYYLIKMGNKKNTIPN